MVKQTNQDQEQEYIEVSETETEEEVVVEEVSRSSRIEKKEKEKSVKPGKKNRKGLGSRLKEVFSELKKVSWPTFKTVVKSTTVVLVVVTIFLLLVWGIDTVLSLGLRAIT